MNWSGFESVAIPLREEPGCDDVEPASHWGLEWLEDFQDRLFPAPRWLYLDLVQAASVCIVLAPPNAGKTFLALEMGAQIVVGAIRQDHGQRLRAVIVEEEGSGAALQRRLARAFAAAGGMPPRSVKVAWNSGRNLLVEDDMRQLAAECMGAELIVLDSLSALCGGLDENDSRAMQAVATALRKLQVLTGASIVALHHTTKESWKPGEAPHQRHLRGHGTLAGRIDTAIALVALDSDEREVRFEVHVVKQRDAEHAKPRQFAIGMRGPAAAVQITQVDLGVSELDGAVVKIRSLLPKVANAIPMEGNDEFTSRAELAHKLSRRIEDIGSAVEMLKNSGIVIEPRKGMLIRRRQKPVLNGA